MFNRAFNQSVSERARQLIEFLGKNDDIMRSIDEGGVIFDLDGKAAAANPAAARLLGRSVREIVGNDLNALIGEGEDNDRQKKDIELRQGDRTLSVSLAPASDTSDQTICTVAVFHDSTQEARVERVKSDFVAIASHEFRTPLNAVLGYIDMLKEDVYGPLTDQQRNALERAAANTGQLVNLINNLLDRTQLETGRLALNVAPLAPGRLVENVQSVMTMTAQSKGLELTGHIADDVPAMLVGDFQRLFQILANLVSNGIKFTDRGSVRMRVYMPASDRWAVEVSDTGRGIAEEAQADIFVPFLQADDPITREYGGAGLGLSIVQQLVGLMGGEIELESEVGRGSTFTVILPLISYPPAGERPAPAQEGAA
jgi:signal transduction histidine kinase